MNQKITLSSLRKAHHLSQRQLAKEVDLSASAIAMYETGRRMPPLKTAIKIGNYFDIPVELILFQK